MYTSPVRGENDDGCQSLVPGDAGQISRTTFPTSGFLPGTYSRSPFATFTRRLVVMYPNGSAYSTSPVVRSIR